MHRQAIVSVLFDAMIPLAGLFLRVNASEDNTILTQLFFRAKSVGRLATFCGGQSRFD
jgi:hypothetical protein